MNHVPTDIASNST